MDISAFIRELLFGHDCVIIPGFGAFIGNYATARIDKDAGIFYPPVRRISFNRNLIHNDGLLAGRISERFRIGFEEAGSKVDEFVGEINRKLERGEKVNFEHIGLFTRNPEGNFLFEPDRNANYYPGSYGLESFQCFPVQGYDVRKQVLSRIDKSPVSQVSMRRIIWRAAVVIPFLAAIVAVSLKTDLFRTRIDSVTMNPLVTAEFENNRKAVDANDIAELTITAAEERVSTEIKPEPLPEIPPAEPAVISADEGPYHIITGSFQSEENALTQSEMLKAEGYDTEIFMASNGFYRVSAMRCRDLNTATQAKDTISRKIPGTWVLKR